jgi:GNAT superfamily N-acetyltransferase
MVLTNASDADIPDLMTWFYDARSTQEWGGWAFRYPFDEKTFREDIQLNELDSFVVRSESGELIAFGQVRNKFGRGHLARLAVAPKYRGRGLGRDLVSSLCQRRSSCSIAPKILCLSRNQRGCSSLLHGSRVLRRSLPKGRLAELGRPSWEFAVDDPEALLADHGWCAGSVIAGTPQANFGRWRYPYTLREASGPGIPRAFLVEGWREVMQ